MRITKFNFIPWLIIFLGSFNLWTTLFPTHHPCLSPFFDIFWPLSGTNSRIFLAIAGLSLFYLGIGLVQRRKVAWFLTEIFLLTSAVVQFRHYNSPGGALINLFMVILLFCQRQQFYGAIFSLNWWRASIFLIAVSSLLFLYLSTIFWLASRYFAAPCPWPTVAKTVLVSFWHFHWQGPRLGNSQLNWFFTAFPYLLGIFIFYSLTLLFRLASQQQQQHHLNWHRAWSQLRHYGRTSADFFKLWPANLHFFFWQRSLIAYWIKGNNYLVAGNPTGPKKERIGIIKKFLHFSGQQNANPLFIGIDKANQQILNKLNFHHIHISDEAFIDLRHHPSDIKSLRNATTKIEQRWGYHFTIWQPPLTKPQLKQLRQISQSWLKGLHRRDGEAIFGSGWLTNMVRASWVPVVSNHQGQPVAFLTLHRSFRPQTMVVNLMRYRHLEKNGIMEYLISKTWEQLGQQGWRWLDLGAAPCQGARLKKPVLSLPIPGKMPSFQSWQKLVRSWPQKTLAISRHVRLQGANFLYFNLLGILATSYRGLRHFKNKFQPNWEPRYLAYLDITSLLYTLWVWHWQKPKPLPREATRQEYYQRLIQHNLKKP